MLGLKIVTTLFLLVKFGQETVFFQILLSLKFPNGGEVCMRTSWLKELMEFGTT